MAEGLLRSLYGDVYEVFSAGDTPSVVHPLAVRAMAEIGIDISGQRSKSIREFQGMAMDFVVTVCKSTVRLSCPFCSSRVSPGTPLIIMQTLPGAKRFIEHGFDDPSDIEGTEEEKLNAFRRVRDQIREWITDFFKPTIA